MWTMRKTSVDYQVRYDSAKLPSAPCGWTDAQPPGAWQSDLEGTVHSSTYVVRKMPGPRCCAGLRPAPFSCWRALVQHAPGAAVTRPSLSDTCAPACSSPYPWPTLDSLSSRAQPQSSTVPTASPSPEIEFRVRLVARSQGTTARGKPSCTWMHNHLYSHPAPSSRSRRPRAYGPRGNPTLMVEVG